MDCKIEFEVDIEMIVMFFFFASYDVLIDSKFHGIYDLHQVVYKLSRAQNGLHVSLLCTGNCTSNRHFVLKWISTNKILIVRGAQVFQLVSRFGKFSLISQKS